MNRRVIFTPRLNVAAGLPRYEKQYLVLYLTLNNIRRIKMKRFILILCILVNSTPAQAGFLGTFFANVASDSLQNKNNGRYTSDPLIKEKKIQAALAVM